MSHQHGCDAGGHFWQCESGECVCICGHPFEGGDHHNCPIELRACPEHELRTGERSEQAAASESTEGWVPLQPTLPEIDERLEQWAASERDSIGFCFLCGGAIASEADLLPDSNYTHNCPQGRASEARIHGGQRPGRTGRKRTKTK